MQTSRYLLALDNGALQAPMGRLTWLNAPGDGECGLATDQLMATQTFYPDHARLTARGIATLPIAKDPMEQALISSHRSKAASLDLIAQAVRLTRPGGLIAVDGDKTDGIESLAKELKRSFDDVQSYSKAHGKLVWFTRPADPPDLSVWEDVTFLYPNGWTTHAASFSSDGPDTGSKLLAEVLAPLKGRVADLGAGWGYLSGEILKSDAVTSLQGIDADYHAVQCAKHNVQDARAAFAWGDVLAEDATGFDAVVTNPPFHTSRKPDPALGVAFIEKAADMLKPKGQLWMVANRNLPYEATLEARFRQVKTVTQNGGFKVIHAQTPKNPRARG
jgi:16S rRNA (guanine1207-N2)-methyltransferase